MTEASEAGRILLSVAIPAFNYAHLLERAVCSVASQLDDKTELLVVDDGSSDHTPDVLARLKIRFPSKFFYVRQTNAGPAAARNHGLKRAQGRFILFLDADDELLPGAIAAIHQAIKENPQATAILGGHRDCFPDGKEKQRFPTPIHGSALERSRNYLIEKRISISHGASVFARELVEQRPYPEHLRQSEDIPVFAYVVAMSTAVLLQRALVRIHKHPDSLRHDSALAQAACFDIAGEVFAHLPAECQVLRRAYEARRALSAFRSCYLAGDWQHAQKYYRIALRQDWTQALRWSYLSKFLRLQPHTKGSL